MRELTARRAEIERGAARRPAPPSLSAALRGDRVAVIAEIKRCSPSKGSIAVGLAAADQAVAYADGGAAAISVVTEPAHFGGSAVDLVDACSGVRIPLLCKDFIVDASQIVEARALGAAAVLLIGRAVPPERLVELWEVAGEYGLCALIEVRTIAELELAVGIGATIIGVNSRNLETLEIDPGVSAALIPQVPPEIIAVAESGVRGPADVRRAAAAGADAVLVGSTVSAALDPAAAVRALTGVAKVGRGRSRG